MPAPVSRHTVVLWAVVAALLGGAVLALYAGGGLDDAAAATGRPLAPGEDVTTSRWVIKVADAEIRLDPILDEPELIVRLEVVNRGDKTELPGGEELVRVQWPVGTDVKVRSKLTLCQPGVRTTLLLRVELPEKQPPGDLPIRVVVMDQKLEDLPYSTPYWVAAGPRGHLDLTAADRRPR